MRGLPSPDRPPGQGGKNAALIPKRKSRAITARLNLHAEERSLDRFLQFLGGAERDLLGSLDLDRFARRRVAAHARTALAHDQDAQAIKADAGALLQMLGDQGD